MRSASILARIVRCPLAADSSERTMNERTCKQSDVVIPCHVAAELAHLLGVSLRASFSDGEVVAALYKAVENREADAQALADVRTLDDWCGTYRQVTLERRGKGFAAILVDSTAEPGERNRGFYGPTPDAARHAAAEWVRKEQGK